MIVRQPRPLLASLAVLLGALLLLAGSRMRSHRVYEPGEDLFGMAIFTRVSESRLVEDATFGGATRMDDGRLVTTYDRAAPAGRRACPT